MFAKMINQSIFSQLGLDDLASETKKELLQAFTTAIFQAVILRATKTLPGDEQNELLRLLKSGPEEELGTFLQTKVPNLSQIVIEESLRFRQSLAERINKTNEKLPAVMNG